jgi:hypothetical protein
MQLRDRESVPEFDGFKAHAEDLLHECTAVVMTAGIPVGGKGKHGAMNLYGTQKSRKDGNEAPPRGNEK